MSTESNYTVTRQCDVLVVGGGIGGVAAAVAAARQGASVILLEKCVNLGGLATTGLISWYEPLCDGAGEQMEASIPEELLRLAIRYGFDDLPEKWGGEGRSPSGARKRYATHFSPTAMMLALDEWLLSNGVELRFDALATYPVMDGRHCRGIEVETVGGREFYGAGVVIDATGTAVILHRAGVPTADGTNWLSYVAHGYKTADAAALAEHGDTRKFRKWVSAGSDLSGNGQPEGVPKVAGVSCEDVTRFMLAGKARMFEKLKASDRFSRDLMDIPFMPQFRTIRHLVGEYVFTGSEDGVKFEDAVGSCGDFRHAGRHFQIPYRCLYHKEFDNLLAAGRVVSAEGDGWEITRVIPVAALTGEAAGVAAALAGKTNTPVCDLHVPTLQATLRGNGVLFK